MRAPQRAPGTLELSCRPPVQRGGERRRPPRRRSRAPPSALGRSYEAALRRRRQHATRRSRSCAPICRRRPARQGGHASAATTGRRRPSRPASTRRRGRRHHHHGRRPPERSRGLPAPARLERPGLRRRLRLAARPQGQDDLPAPALDGRQLADRQGHRHAHPRQRLHPQGLPARRGQEGEPLRRDAPLPRPHDDAVGLHLPRGGGQPPGPPVRPQQVRHLAHLEGLPRPAHGEDAARLHHPARDLVRPLVAAVPGGRLPRPRPERVLVSDPAAGDDLLPGVPIGDGPLRRRLRLPEPARHVRRAGGQGGRFQRRTKPSCRVSTGEVCRHELQLAQVDPARETRCLRRGAGRRAPRRSPTAPRRVRGRDLAARLLARVHLRGGREPARRPAALARAAGAERRGDRHRPLGGRLRRVGRPDHRPRALARRSHHHLGLLLPGRAARHRRRLRRPGRRRRHGGRPPLPAHRLALQPPAVAPVPLDRAPDDVDRLPRHLVRLQGDEAAGGARAQHLRGAPPLHPGARLEPRLHRARGAARPSARRTAAPATTAPASTSAACSTS